MRYFLVLLVCLAGCSPYRQGPGDMRYTIHVDSPGTPIMPGDFLSVHYRHFTANDSLLASSYLIGHPVFFEQQRSFFKGDIFAGLSMLSEGDSATFLLNFDSMHIILNVPQPANAGPELVFAVKVEKVIARAGKADSVFQREVRDWYAYTSEQARWAEAGRLQPWSAWDSTASGLRYQILSPGEGVQAKPGDSVQFEHTGRYLSGRAFASNNKDTALRAGIYDERRPYRPEVAVAGIAGTMPGVDEALLLFPAGTRVRLVLPSRLAYGAAGNSMFPPYTPLMFDLHILQ